MQDVDRAFFSCQEVVDDDFNDYCDFNDKYDFRLVMNLI